MKAINLRWFIFFQILFYSILSCKAQEKNEWDSLENAFEHISDVKMSDDSNWISWRSLKGNEKKLMLKNTVLRKSKIIELEYPTNYGFLNNNYLFLQFANRFMLVNLKTNEQFVWSDVQDFYVDNTQTIFLLKKSETNRYKLLIINKNGMQITEIVSVKKMLKSTVEKRLLFSTVENSKEVLFEYTNGYLKKIFSISSEIINAEYLPLLNIYMTVFKDTVTHKNSVARIDSDGKMTLFELPQINEILSIKWKELPARNKIGIDILFKQKNLEDNDVVDIWTSTDKNLQRKVLPNTLSLTWEWDIKTSEQTLLTTKNLDKILNINNKEVVLAFKADELQDYTKKEPDIVLYKIHTGSKKTVMIDTIKFSGIYSNSKGSCIVYPYRKGWKMYNLNNEDVKILDFFSETNYPVFKDNNVIFQTNKQLFFYNINDFSLQKIIKLDGNLEKILNANKFPLLDGYNFYNSEIKSNESLIIILSSDKKHSTNFKYIGKDLVTLTSPKILKSYSHILSKDKKKLLCIEESLNQPPTIILFNCQSKTKIYTTKIDQPYNKTLKLKFIVYEGNNKELLKGLLYYPLDFVASNSYLVVVNIYEKQSHRANDFLYPTRKESLGVNIRILLERGYFVFLPDINYDLQLGSGKSALNCVNKALDKLLLMQSVDKNKIALVGHSFGAYETNYIATQSKRFATYISGAGNIDIVHTYHTFSLGHHQPEFWKYENWQYRMNEAFYQNKQKYFDNNPLYNVDRINAPILLWTGTDDYNVRWEETRTFLNALIRNKKKSIALFYTKNPHTLNNVNSQIDLSSRILEWLDFFLKGNTEVEWINMAFDK